MPELIIGVVLLIITAYCVFLFIAYKDKQKIKTKTISLLNQYGKVVIKDKKYLFRKKTKTYLKFYFIKFKQIMNLRLILQFFGKYTQKQGHI